MNPFMRSALRKLGWGLLFPLFDFRLGFFDIFPDVIGYILISIALGQLGAEVAQFKHAKLLAAVLMLLSLPQLLANMSIDINQFAASTFAMHAYVQGTAILHGWLIYLIFRGLYRLAKPLASSELLNSIVSRRNLYMTVLALQLFFYPFLLNVDESWLMLLFFIGFIYLIAELLLIRLSFRLSRL